MKNLKKFSVILWVLCVILSVTSSVFANADSERKTDQKNLEYISQNWIESQLGNHAQVSRIVYLYNVQNQLIGHLVSFQKKDKPAGYIVLSIKEKEHPIVEFSLDGENVYSYLENEFKKSKNSFNSTRQSSGESASLSAFSIAEENVLYTNFIDYALKIKDNHTSLLYNQKKQIVSYENTSQNILKTAVPYTDTFYNDYINFPSDNSGIQEVWSIPGANINGLVMGSMPNTKPGEGNCGPTALANTVKIYAENRTNNQDPLSNLKLNNSDNNTYTRLVQLSGYSSSSGASMSSLLNALKKYSKERGYSCSVDNYWFDNWGDFTRDLKANKPILLYTSSSAGTAHTQVAVGYYLYKSGAKYLKIFSGWSSNATFVKYKPSSLNHFDGYCITIAR